MSLIDKIFTSFHPVTDADIEMLITDPSEATPGLPARAAALDGQTSSWQLREITDVDNSDNSNSSLSSDTKLKNYPELKEMPSLRGSLVKDSSLKQKQSPCQDYLTLPKLKLEKVDLDQEIGVKFDKNLKILDEAQSFRPLDRVILTKKLAAKQQSF